MNRFAMLRSRGFARLALLPIMAGAGLFATPPTSDQIAVYAIVDSVVLTPDDDTPTAIRIHGTFSVSAQEAGDHYGPATRGYLYYTVDPARANVTRAEWADMQRAAGKGTIVGFGSKYVKPLTRVRCASEPVASPDVYQTGIGMVKAVIDGNAIRKDIEGDLRSGRAPAARCK